MRKTKAVNERVCDNCGKIQSDDGELHFGGTVFAGWVSVDTEVHTPVRRQQPPTLDFCSPKCVGEYYGEKEVPVSDSQYARLSRAAKSFKGGGLIPEAHRAKAASEKYKEGLWVGTPGARSDFGAKLSELLKNGTISIIDGRLSMRPGCTTE